MMVILHNRLTMSHTRGMSVIDHPHNESPLHVRLLTLILRVSIGLLLMATALGKSLDVNGFAQVIGTYEVFSQILWLPIAVAMIVLEAGLALLLLHGRFAKHGGGASTVLHAGFMIWAIVALARGLEIPNCGCFGVFLSRPLTWGTVLEDAVLVAVSLLLWWAAPEATDRPAGTCGHRETVTDD